MQKIISLFQRNYDTDHMVRNEIVPGAEWVLAGEGVATRKYDGTCCMVREGKLYKRHEVKLGKNPPIGFEPATEIDANTGKQRGWLPVGDGPEDAYHREAFEAEPDGTYELCGPKVQGNPEAFCEHRLIAHADAEQFADFPKDFDSIKAALKDAEIEGVVWHHPDGRMVKIKRRDFWR